MNTSSRPEGIFPALPTPMTENKDINYDALEEHLDYVEGAGVHGFVPAGCTGHAASLEPEEHVEYVANVAEMTDVPVIAGDGMNVTSQTVSLATEIEDTADVDGHLLISPYQNKPPQRGIREHYESVADAVEEPCIVYNVPSRTGKNVEADTTLALAEHPNIVGIKEASGDYEQMREIGREDAARDLDFVLGSGDDPNSDFIYENNGAFTISVTANVDPESVVDVWETGYLEQDHQEAYEKNAELEDLHHAMFVESNPIPVHEALNKMGFDYGQPRSPLHVGLTEEQDAELEETLQQYDLV